MAVRAGGLSLAPHATSAGVASSEAEQQLARWIDRSARGDRANFEKRLAWDGLDITDAAGGLRRRRHRR